MRTDDKTRRRMTKNQGRNDLSLQLLSY